MNVRKFDPTAVVHVFVFTAMVGSYSSSLNGPEC